MKRGKLILAAGLLCMLSACVKRESAQPSTPAQTMTTEAGTQGATEQTSGQENSKEEGTELASAANVDMARENLRRTIETYLPGIVCWGDSLTLGAGSDIAYPEMLAQMINEEILADCDCEIPVVNMGIGGEKSSTIAARACGMPMLTMAEFTIPAECVNVQINFRNEEGQLVEPMLYGTAGMEYVEINGIRGTLEFLPDVKGESGGNYLYYFKRNEPGEATVIPAGTKILTRGYQEYHGYLPIIFMGENGGFEDCAQLIRQQLSIVEAGDFGERYLMIGLTSGTAAERASMEADMQARHGSRYVNARAILSAEGAAIAEIETTVFDQWMTDEGKIPGRLLSDSVHFNEAGYRALAKVIYGRLKELGYFDEVFAAAEVLRNLK